MAANESNNTAACIYICICICIYICICICIYICICICICICIYICICICICICIYISKNINMNDESNVVSSGRNPPMRAPEAKPKRGLVRCLPAVPFYSTTLFKLVGIYATLLSVGLQAVDMNIALAGESASFF